MGVFGTRGNHATWRRFQDKWGRSATLNRRFKDKDRWFWGEPRDLRENSNFHITPISIQMCLTMAYILWAETPKRPNKTKSLVKPKQKHYKFLFYDLKLIRDLFKGLGHDPINCSENHVTIPNHASITKIIQPTMMLTVHIRENLERRLHHLNPSKKTMFHWSF